jgi:GNAT superfamily N-acetyltransferase
MPFIVTLIEDASTLLNQRDAVADAYLETYSLPPYFENQQDVVLFKQRWPKLINKPNFRLAIAHERGSQQLIGFAYGWLASPSDDLHGILLENLEAAQSVLWTSDSFELADFAILPGYQGKGAGREIYSRLFDGVSQKCAILKTHASDSVAVQMYRRRGWKTLIDQLIWGPKKLPYMAMGLSLRMR